MSCCGKKREQIRQQRTRLLSTHSSAGRAQPEPWRRSLQGSGSISYGRTFAQRLPLFQKTGALDRREGCRGAAQDEALSGKELTVRGCPTLAASQVFALGWIWLSHRKGRLQQPWERAIG